MKTLHILNGDGVLGAFQKAKIGGKCIIFRETFSEGKIHSELFTDAFWQIRKKFISETYEKFIPPNERMNYETEVRAEIQKLDFASDFDEVILWFEYDLFCQVNLIFCLNYLTQKPLKNTTIKLICPDRHPEISDFRGLGQLTPLQLKNLLPTALTLTSEDLKYAKEILTAYLAPTPEKLHEILKIKQSNFPHLNRALEAHLARFPDSETGLSLPSKIILETVKEDKPKTVIALIKGFWKRDKIYGFGDLQILDYVQKISPELITFDGRAMSDFEPIQFLHFSGKIELSN